MATTSIWAVKGWLGRVMIYTENPEKTENPAHFQLEGASPAELQGLSDVLDYAQQSTKTERRFFVSGVNCSPLTARADMMEIKTRFEKEGGIVAFHGYQSFAPGEVAPQTAHEIGLRLAQQLWGDRFQVVVCTHLDKGHVHNHFVLNTVSCTDGRRYHRTKQDYRDLRQTSDDLCREYGLSVVDQPVHRGHHYAEWQDEKLGKPTYRSMVQADIDRALAAAMTERQFFESLKAMGYQIKMGKDITLCASGRDRGLKLQRNFGGDYSIEGIRRRILEQARPKRPAPESPRKIAVYRLHGQFRLAPRMKGFRALYFRYLYLLGKLPKKRQRPPEKIHPIYRGELIKIDQISRELRLLCQHQIDTPEQLSAFKAKASKKEAAICDRVLFRVQEMRSNMQTQKNEDREVKPNERRRRR